MDDRPNKSSQDNIIIYELLMKNSKRAKWRGPINKYHHLLNERVKSMLKRKLNVLYCARAVKPTKVKEIKVLFLFN